MRPATRAVLCLWLQEVFDAIICDPPYGVRAGGKKSVAKEHKVKCSETHIPSTDPYPFEECLKDLLHLAAKHLKLGARLVFFLPSAPGLDKVPWNAAHPTVVCMTHEDASATSTALACAICSGLMLMHAQHRCDACTKQHWCMHRTSMMHAQNEPGAFTRQPFRCMTGSGPC